MWLGDEEVSAALRSEAAGMAASRVAALPEVRAALLERAEGCAYRPGPTLRNLPHEVRAPTLRGRAPFVVEDLAAWLHTTVRLGVVDGLEVARALRADAALRDTRLVALSGYACAEDRERARDAGFDEHVPKPADAELLVRVLAGGP